MTNKRILYSLIWISIIYVIAVPIYLFFANNYASTDLFLLLGATVGLVLFVILFWQYVLSLKILTKYLDLNLSTVIELHKNLGIYSVMLLFIHPIYLIIDSLFNSGYVHIIPDLTSKYDFRVFLGEMVFLLIFVTWLLSYLAKKYVTFRFWKFTHLLTYVILPITYLHADDIGTFISNPLLNIFIKGLTFLFGLIALARLIDASGTFKFKYKVKTKKMYNDILELTLVPNNISSRVVSKMGQFIYIQTKMFGEAHPYSVLWNDYKTGELSLGVKVTGKFGQELENLPTDSTVMLDGPHGKFLDGVEEQKHVVFIAGGIGITPFVEVVGNSNSLNGINRIDFFYATRTLKDSVFINKSSVKNWPKVRLVNVVQQLDKSTEPKIEAGYVTFEILKKYMGELTSGCDYYICGPVPMMKAVTQQLLNNDIKQERIHTEEFGW